MTVNRVSTVSVAATVSTVTLSGYFAEVLVVNQGATVIYVTTDGTTPAAGVANDSGEVVLPASSASFANLSPEPDQGDGTTGATVVKLIGSAAGPSLVTVSGQ